MFLLAARFRALVTAAQLCAAFALLSSGSSPATAADSDGVVVSTYAGSGELGMADGDAKTATFMLPAGLAAGPGGTIYVSDQAAQRIRAITAGKVTTLAGSGDPDVLGLTVPGGYLDGPALAARFHDPLGLAVGPNGAVYVADSQNASIRMFEGGVVSTVVGRPGSTVAVDGDAATARLVEPRSLAFDRTGKLWIADYRGGLRCWDRGRLTTVPLKAGVTDVLSVSTQPDDDEILVATTSILFRLSAHDTYAPVVVGDRLGLHAVEEGGNDFGTPSSIAGIGHGQLLFTDLLANNVRYVRFPAPPFVVAPYSRAIAGGVFERRADNVGFADGGSLGARFASPRGLIVTGSTAFVADSANRRIRRFEVPQFRLPETGENSAYAYDRAHFEVALVGGSIVYFDSHDGDSMCAAIEQRLDANGFSKKPARCHTVRIDGGLVPALEDYVKANLAFRPVDLVVLSIVPGLAYAFDSNDADASLARFRESIADLQRALAPNTNLAVFFEYPDAELSNREQLGTAEIDPAFPGIAPDALSRTQRGRDVRVIASLEGLGVTVCDAFDAAVAYERGTGPPLYSPDNGHYIDRGNAFFGTTLADCIAREPALGRSK